MYLFTIEKSQNIMFCQPVKWKFFSQHKDVAEDKAEIRFPVTELFYTDFFPLKEEHITCLFQMAGSSQGHN